MTISSDGDEAEYVWTAGSVEVAFKRGLCQMEQTTNLGDSSIQRPVSKPMALGIRIAGVIVLTVVVVWLAYRVRAVFTPILVSAGLAYILNPLVTSLKRKRIPRLASVIGIYVLLAGIIAMAMPVVISEVIAQGSQLSQTLAGYTQEKVGYLQEKYPQEFTKYVLVIKEQLAKYGTRTAGYLAEGLTAILSSVFNLVTVLVLIPLYTFFFLWRFDSLIEKIAVNMIPAEYRVRTVKIAKAIDAAVASFFRGRLLVCLAVGVATTIGYAIAGIPFALLLGPMIGVMNLIPFLSTVLGLPPSLLAAYVGHGDLVHPLYAGIVFMIVQSCDAFVLTPWIQGKALGLHPITIVIVLLMGSELGGLFGMLLAIPAACVVKILFLEFVWPHLKELTGQDRKCKDLQDLEGSENPNDAKENKIEQHQ